MIERFERFSLAIFEISRCWHKLAAEEMAKYGLKGPHAVYLLTMRRNPEGITSAQLGEQCGRDKADVSRTVALLEEKKMIVREGSQYRARLKLTDLGHEASTHVCSRVAVAMEYAGRGFSEENRTIFYEVLEQITENLHMLSMGGLPEA